MHPLYAQSLFEEQGYACASIKHVVTRHARMAAATPMLGISEAVGALYRRDCCSGRERVSGRLAATEVVSGVAGAERWRCRRASARRFVSRASRALDALLAPSEGVLMSLRSVFFLHAGKQIFSKRLVLLSSYGNEKDLVSKVRSTLGELPMLKCIPYESWGRAVEDESWQFQNFPNNSSKIAALSL